LGFADDIIPARGEMGSVLMNPTDQAGAAPAELLPNEADFPSALWAGTSEVELELGIPLHLFSRLERAAVKQVTGDQADEEPVGGGPPQPNQNNRSLGTLSMQEELKAEAIAEGSEGEPSPATPARTTAGEAPTVRATGRQATATPGVALRGLSAGETVRNTKNAALTQELHRNGIRMATMLKSAFPITRRAIKSKLNLIFDDVPLDSVPADTAIQIGRSLEDNQATFDAIHAGLKAAAHSGSRWVGVARANLPPGVVDVAVARMIKSGELGLDALSLCEGVYGIFPVTAVFLAPINRDFHASFSDATSKLTIHVLEALQLDELGAPDLVTTDLRIRTLAGTHPHNQELISFNGITESLARLIVSSDKLHPIAMYPRLQGDWLRIYDNAIDILEERSENKITHFDESRYYLIGDALEFLARDVLTI
jgi:hypothetical protein